MGKYDLTVGIREKALRIAVYGPEGIGKTTLAAEFPNPIFIDVEDGSNQLPVARMPRPTSWAMLMDEVRAVRDGDVPGCSTLIIDTADATEQLCIDAVCAEKSIGGIEDAGYGKGYTYLAEKYGKLLDALGEVVDTGRNVVVVSHALCRKFERPDEEGAYDRYELKLSRKVAPMVKEWCDMLLFLDYKTIVETKSDKQGNVTKAKAKGGRRIIHTQHHPCWDAKNRFGLKDPLPLEYASIAACVPDMMGEQPTAAPSPKKSPALQEVDARIANMEADVERAQELLQKPEPQPEVDPDPIDAYPEHCRALADLMRAEGITDEELRRAMAAKGYVMFDTPVSMYKERLVDGVIAAWDNFVKFVKEQRTAINTPIPF